MVARFFSILISCCLILGACQSDGNVRKAANQKAEAEIIAAAPSDKLILLVKDQQITKGETICLDVRTNQFKQILSMQYTMHWDPKLFKFVKVDGFQLKDLSAKNFGTNNVQNGNLPISWYDLDVKGLSVPDNTSIYQVCLEAIGEAGQVSNFNFDGNPVTVEISNSTGQVIQFSSRKAKITIQ